jgi:nucleoside-triphosphatase
MTILLLTGKPHIGKTTIIKKVVRLVNNIGGFYTQELRLSDGRRAGFEIVTLSGEKHCLATKRSEINFPNQIPFGEYKINIDAINLVGVPSLQSALEEEKVICIDEIGPMEIFSENFRNTILKILDSDAKVIGTIVQRPYEFADMVKSHFRVKLIEVTYDNRDALPKQITRILECYD